MNAAVVAINVFVVQRNTHTQTKQSNKLSDLVVLGMVDLHDLGVHHGLQSMVVVGQVRQRVLRAHTSQPAQRNSSQRSHVPRSNCNPVLITKPVCLNC
jgi:hypothetical protein